MLEYDFIQLQLYRQRIMNSDMYNLGLLRLRHFDIFQDHVLTIFFEVKAFSLG
jgi:hypothetical protein